MPDYTSLANSYYDLSCSSSPLDSPQENYLLINTFIILFSDVYLFAFLLVLPHSMVHAHSPHFASFFVSLDLIWQPDSLINMDGTISL